MLKILTIKILSLLASVLTGCAIINNLLLEKSIKEDITKLLKRHKITDVKTQCYFGRENKYGYCILVTTPQSLGRLIERLNLRDFESESQKKYSGNVYANQWSVYQNNRDLWDRPYTCGYLKKFNNLKKVKVYVSSDLDRFSQLTIENKRSFKNLFLYNHLDSNEACIHVNYPSD